MEAKEERTVICVKVKDDVTFFETNSGVGRIVFREHDGEDKSFISSDCMHLPSLLSEATNLTGDFKGRAINEGYSVKYLIFESIEELDKYMKKKQVSVEIMRLIKSNYIEGYDLEFLNTIKKMLENNTKK